MTSSPLIYSITHDILGDPFWAVYDRGVVAAGNGLGCAVRSVRPERYAPGAMPRLVEEALKEGAEGILCTIPDAAALDEPLREAVRAGVAVVAANARDQLSDAARIPYLLYVGGDDRAAGRRAGERLLAAGAQDVLCFDHYLVDQHCHAERFDGLAEAIAARGGACRRVAVAGDDPAAAVARIRAALNDDPAADGVVTLGPPGAEAALCATEGRAIAHVTFDLSVSQIEALRAGRVVAIIDSQQYLQGFLGVQVLCLYLRYGLLPVGDILTGPSLIDAANLAKAERAFRTGAR